MNGQYGWYTANVKTAHGNKSVRVLCNSSQAARDLAMQQLREQGHSPVYVIVVWEPIEEVRT